jgi:hypothetical protein
MTSREHLRWLAEARALLIDAAGLQLGPVHVWVWYEVTRAGVEFTLPPNGPDDQGWPSGVISTAGPPGPPAQVVLPNVAEPLPELDADDVAVLRALQDSSPDKSVIGRHVARRVSEDYKTGLRTRLSRLHNKLHLLENQGKGYWITPRGLAALQQADR